MYDHGEGVWWKDQKEACRWYRKAAERGDIKAQYNLGVMYEGGQGVAQDYKEALKWYQKAAIKSHAWAEHNLGCMYENGRGVEKNLHTARYWYQKAAYQGSEDAKRALIKLNSWRYMLLGF